MGVGVGMGGGGALTNICAWGDKAAFRLFSSNLCLCKVKASGSRETLEKARMFAANGLLRWEK